MEDKIKGINFQVDPATHAKLLAIAQGDGLSLQDVLQSIVSTYAERMIRVRDKNEKREFPRNQTSLPVVIQLRFEPNEAHYRTGTIKNISMGGVRICMPKNERMDPQSFERCKTIEILFRVPGEKHTATFTCRPSNFMAEENEIQLGATFTKADLRSQQILHKYVM